MSDTKKPAKAELIEKGLLKRFYNFAFYSSPEWGKIINFMAVGALGFICNITLMTFLLWIEVDLKIALAAGITLSAIINFFLDRHVVFSHARHGSFFWQLIGFVFVCFFGSLINYYISIGLLVSFNWMLPQIAATVGAIGTTIFSYIFLRFGVFRM